MKTRSIRDTTFRKEEKEVEQMEFKKKILVIGSLNMDLVVETPHMPKAGETITGKSITNVLGGKGANQAYAAGKLGGNVGMIGAVGNDACGRALKQNLECVHVDTSGIEVLENEMSGQAFITVDDNGENAIIIIAGTNGMVTKEMIQKHISLRKATLSSCRWRFLWKQWNMSKIWHLSLGSWSSLIRRLLYQICRIVSFKGWII